MCALAQKGLLPCKINLLKAIFQFFSNEMTSDATMKQSSEYIEEYFRLKMDDFIMELLKESNDGIEIDLCYQIFIAIIETDPETYKEVV